jgi:hypothetical protein
MFPYRFDLLVPPNLVWVGAFESILPDQGISGVILDGGHYTYAVSAQPWRWTMSTMNAFAMDLLDPEVDPAETRRVVPYGWHRRESSANEMLRCFFRDNDAVLRFSFGNQGLLHRLRDFAGLASFADELRAQISLGSLVTLADDGERVNPLALYTYEAFLHLIGEGACVLPSDCSVTTKSRELGYLPSYALGDLDDFLRSGIDSRHYIDLLAEIYESERIEAEDEEELLALQDLYFLYWKTNPRKRAYLERLLELRRRLRLPARGDPISD